MTISSFETKRGKILTFVKKYHSKCTRKGPAEEDWHHADRVSWLLELILRENGEFNQVSGVAALAALGHDLVEDTRAKETEIKKVFGKEGFIIIEGMTNRKGDKIVGEYVKQVCLAPELVRLVKLSDLFDNCASILYNLDRIGGAWTKKVYLPIVTPMATEIVKTTFEEYPETGATLKNAMQAIFKTLVQNTSTK
jgi:(p)ppGpp synthase/HD superfamily hydrolase